MSLALKWGNLAVAFLLEFCLLAAFCFWGFHANTSVPAKVALGIGLPLVVAVFWGLFMAPRARYPVSRPLYWVNYCALFGIGALMLAFAGQLLLGIVFAIVALLNMLLTISLRQR
ncbi:MAG TPA: YrdB family protein [Ktedonobacterales bacterium]